MKLLAIFPFLIFLSACSAYKSQDRNQLQSDVDQSIKSTGYTLTSCKKQNSIAAWFQSEFPNKNYELVVLESDLEVWKSLNPNETVDIKAVQIDEKNNKTVCNYQFANMSTWESYQKEFILELQENTLTE